MPQPEISSQPVCLQMRQPAPSQNTQLMSTSADGSVNGKYDGRSRILRSRSKKASQEAVQHRLHVGEADALVDHQAFDLVEHRRVRDVGSLRYTRPGAITANGALAREHRADLHRRGMRAQQLAVGEVERVVHRARRMIRGNVQRLEVVEVVLDLRARSRRRSRPGGTAARCAAATLVTGCSPPRSSPRPGSVTSMRSLRELLRDRGLLELERASSRWRPGTPRARVDARAGLLALLGGKLAQRLELLGEPAALAEPAHAHFLERRQIARVRNRAESFLPARIEILGSLRRSRD